MRPPAAGIRRAWLALLLAGAPLLPAGPARGAPSVPTVPATVLEVVDGDSAHVTLNGRPETIRLFGVDTPEGDQPFGRESARELQRLVGGRTLQLQIIRRADRYGRPVVIAWRGEQSVNAALLAGGYGWAYREYLDQVPDGGEYCRLEAAAREARRGLWGQPEVRIVPPWQWRRQERGEAVVFTRPGDLSLQNCLDAIPRGRDRGDAPVVEAGSAQGCRIKGNINGRGERIYHLPGSPSYAETRINPAAGERWFCTESEARAAGWRPPR